MSRVIEEGLVTIERDGYGVDLVPGDTGSFKIAIVGNPTTPGNFNINLLTQNDSGQSLDSGSRPVTIKAGPLDHFIISSISNKIAGSTFSFSITAKDFYSNNVVFSGAVYLSDNTGTLTPTQVLMSGTSFTVNNAKITTAQGGVKITASAVVGGKTKIGTSNSFNVNQIRIFSIEAAATTVSRQQTNIPVTMAVQNMGADTVRLDSAKLVFSPSTGYTGTRLVSSVKIPGQGAIQNLVFSANVSNTANLGSTTIDGQVYGKVIPDNVIISDLQADPPLDLWTVQTPPSLSYETSSLSPSLVGAGAFYQFQVGIRNNGQATLELNPATTTFQFTIAPGQTFTAALDATGGTTLAGSGQTKVLTFQSTQIPPDTPLDDYTPQVILNGTQNGAPFSGSVTLSSLRVVDAPSLQMVSVNTTQDTVTQGMSKPWLIFLRVRNNSSLSVTFDRVNLQFFKLGSGSPDSFYRFDPPTQFASGSDLAANAEDSVICRIDATGQTTGIVAIFAEVYVQGISDPAESNGTQKSILVQTPASLSVALRTSQSTVTQNQTVHWQVFMKVKNAGESAARAIFNENDPAHSTGISLAQTPGYQVTSPTTNVIISGKDSTEIVFEVDTTGSNTGINRTIHGQVYAQEINSGDFYIDTTADRDSALFTVQLKAYVQIDSVQLAKVFNGNTVNTYQSFQVRLKVKQTVVGAEKVDSVRVRLATSGPATVNITKNPRTLTDLSQWLYFDVTANNTTGQVTFLPSITAAYSANTGANTVAYNTSSVTTTALIQQPGSLKIGSLTTSDSSLRFGRTQPWYIFVPVENNGGSQSGTLGITSSQVTATIGGELQYDYKINAPTNTIWLAAGKKDTLKFEVTRTGYSGGTVTLTAILNVLDKNSNGTYQKSATGTITVVSSPLVKILRTDFPATANRVPESEIALVDTGQVFNIEVTVENTSSEVIDTAYVSLTNTTPNGNSLILTPQAKAVAIPTNPGTAKAIFKVRAGSFSNSETFVARLDSAVTQQGGESADIGPANDSIAVARIQLPPRLKLNLYTNVPNNRLTTGQTFTLRAVVNNRGQAQTDSTGILEFQPNPNFQLLATQTPAKQSFVVDDTVKWQIQAPNKPRPADTLRVIMSPRPRSKNSGAIAQVEGDTVATLVVSTFNSLLLVTSTSIMDPLGAQDAVISTEQFFTVKSQISASSDLTNKTVMLALPDGYNFSSGETPTKAIPDNGTVYWEVQAPTDAESNSVNLQVTAQARDGQAQPTQSKDTLAVITKRRAILNLTPGISAPAGARNGVLSAGQAFTLSAILANTGEANLSDTVTVELDLGNTGISISPSLMRRTVVFKPDGQVKTITWPAVAPDSSMSASDLIFRITRLPLDENTNKAALPLTNPVTFNLTTVVRGSIAVGGLRIVSPAGAMDNVLSTDQDFVVSDSIFWTNATQIDAKLWLPANYFSTDNENQSLVNVPDSGSAKLSWRVWASGQSVQNAELKLVVTAMDAHNDASPLAPAADTLLVSVQQRADPRLRAFISSPPAATDKVVSVGQPFEVTAVLENNGQALLSGEATVSIKLPPLAGYRMANAQDTVQTSESGRFTWSVLARPTISMQTDYIEFNLVKAPRDTNTNQLAASTQRVFQLDVRTEARTLLAEKVGRTGGPTFRGQTNLPLLRVKLTNPGGPGSSNLVLQKLRVTLRDRDNVAVPANQALKAIRVVDDARRKELYGELSGIVTTDPSLVVNFTRMVVIQPGVPDTIAILGDIADNTEAQNFRVAFASSQDFEVVDQDSGNVVVVQDQDGNSGPKFNLNSDLAVLFDSEPKNSFYNYPNPVKPGNNYARGEGTFFTYNLPEASSGELKIFTLLGELVWETSFSATDPAGSAYGHTRDLFWNGYNGANRRVLNGVYIALLKTGKYGTFMTKVAVVK